MSTVHRIAIETRSGETRVALLDQKNTPLQFLIERDYERSFVGGIYLGRVAAVRKSIGAAFIDIGVGVDGFLNIKEGAKDACGTAINEGASVLVQVNRDAEASKGPSLTTQIDIAGKYMVMTPGKSGIGVSKRITDDVERDRIRSCFENTDVEKIGFVVRTVAQTTKNDKLEAEALDLKGKWEALQSDAKAFTAPSVIHPSQSLAIRVINEWVRDHTHEVVVDSPRVVQLICDASDAGDLVRQTNNVPAFEDTGVADAFEGALLPTISLSSGGSIIVTETPAMTTIDVNAGRGHGGDAERLALDINLEAAEATAQAILQRNIGGLIAIDFMRMKKPENRAEVLSGLRRAFADNPRGPRIGDFSAFGLVDVVCRREGKSLSEHYLSNQHVKSVETVAIDILTSLNRRGGTSAHVRVSKDVSDVLHGALAGSVKGLEDRLGFAIDIETIDVSDAQHYEITDDT